MENLINEKLTRFKYCDPEFYPHIERVLLKLHKEVCFLGILDDQDLQIISWKVEAWGRQVTFANKVKALDYFK